MQDDFAPSDETPPELASSAKTRASEKVEELRMHAELAAIFEGTRKFNAEILPDLTFDTARDIQKAVAQLERSRMDQAPQVIDPASEHYPHAARLLSFSDTHNLSTNDYHVHRRPGEVMIARFLSGEQLDTFYTRLQAHFDAGREGTLEDERSESAWKSDPNTTAYLDALEATTLNLPERYLRPLVQEHTLFALSTQTADEINIAFLTDHIMNVTPAELLGPHSAPPDNPTDSDLAWYFKLFMLRGKVGDSERALFFTFLQKTDDSPW